MIYTIPTEALNPLKSQIDRLNKRCVRLGVPEIVFKVLESGKFQIKHNGSTVAADAHKIEVIGETPRMNGWMFIATIIETEAGNTFKILNEAYPIPEEYRNRPHQCDHCQTNRMRKDTYIVHNPDTSEWRQVGRSCLKDFTGHKNPEALAQAAELFRSALDSIKDMCDEEGNFFGRGIRQRPHFEILPLMVAAIRFIEQYGYTSRKAARESTEYKTATADDVIGYFLSPTKQADEIKLPDVTDKMKAEASAAIEWASNIEANDNDYLYNIRTIANCQLIDEKLVGLAISIIPSYRRELSKQAEASLSFKDEFYGELKQKIDIKGMCTKVISMESSYGTLLIIKFVSDGYTFIWKTNPTTVSNITLDQNKTYQIKASIKAHNLYNGKKQTIITRAKLKEVL